MATLQFMERGARGAGHDDWPLFYMNDFSRLGVVVDSLGQAAAALADSGFLMREGVGGGRLELADHSQMAAVFAVLESRRIRYELADLVSCVYQG